MDIGSIFLILALLIPVVIYISRPLLERSTGKSQLFRAGYFHLCWLNATRWLPPFRSWTMTITWVRSPLKITPHSALTSCRMGLKSCAKLMLIKYTPPL